MIALSAIHPAIGRLLYERACQAVVHLETHVLAQGRTRAPKNVGSSSSSSSSSQWPGGSTTRTIGTPASTLAASGGTIGTGGAFGSAGFMTATPGFA
jgi:hypothetical protein